MSTNRLQRTHRSTKIPNAKIRPVPARRALSERAIADAEDDAHFQQIHDKGTIHGAHTQSDFAGAQRPLRGVVLCLTGITEEKRELISIAEQLGAQVHMNLTSQVTHLIARAAGSEKYKCAAQFHMRIVRPEWLYVIRESWLAGDDAVDIDRLADAHALGALEGLTIALSGVDGAQREALLEKITDCGGQVAPRLVLDGTLTHLACAESARARKSFARVVEQQTLARKYEATQALPAQVRAAMAIQLVHTAWIDDCCSAKALLPEAVYEATRPVPSDEERREYVAARITRTRPQHAPLEEPVVHVASPATHAAPPLHTLVPTERNTTEPHFQRRASLATLSRAERFGQEVCGVFFGIRLCIAMQDGARSRRVASAVRAAGAVLVDKSVDAQYTIAPLLGAPLESGTLVTHHWVELCLYHERVLDPVQHLACVPSSAQLPIPGAERVYISFTGVDRQGPEYHHALAAIQALGAVVEDTFSKARTTHLLCGSEDAMRGIKVAKAREWGVPVVGYAFLQDALRTGRLEGMERSDHRGGTHAEDHSVDHNAWREMESRRGGQSDRSEPGTALPTRSMLPSTPQPDPTMAARNPPPDNWWSEQTTSHEPTSPHIVYDDPAARKEHSRLLALVDGAANTKRKR
ncbi:protein kinase activating protein dpb11 [Malassezia vespertilionis]|uniref:BRCT domain-containing protein n=1 Tax=Malassezia vespertilionis TaxID=2020962 RepID=A0A2N1J827_9BASI|nr:protein kinase activating protein dpb11 [Malassezia vespertilionis]PKI82708.1 hypothetical protein MVES_003344 [Malassezia vespertilionis]WFD08416.1 protein kinase activating protein dpb11 [Malassezia vespertilionis]